MVSKGGSLFEDFLIMSGLLLVQAVYGFYTIFLNRVLALGFNSLFMIYAGNFAGAIFLLPLAVVIERKKWPLKITATMMIQFGLIALGGVTIFQGLLLMGIKRTTPAIASAMPNLVPGFVFIIAAALSQAKILGTVVCLGGAIAMSLLQTPTAAKILFFSAEDSNYNDWLVGCFYLLAAIITISSVVVLQAATMVSFPAPFSLCVMTSLMGSIITGILQILTEGKLKVGSSDLDFSFIILVVVVGSVINSTCVVYQTWCVRKKGPLLVSIFSPIQTVCATSLCMILFGQSISLGSSIGMLVMIIGLYLVLWAKRRESFEPVEDGHNMPHGPLDIEKPLLS